MTIELFDPRVHYAAPANAQLTFRGGPLIQDAKLFGVFVDDPATGQPHPLTSQLSAYLDWYGSSDLITELAEYNVHGPVSHAGDARMGLDGSTPTPPPPSPPPPPVPGPPPPPPHHRHHRHRCGGSLSLPHRIGVLSGTVVQDSDLQNLLDKAISAGSLPKPDGSLLFVLFLPDGVTVQLGSDAACTTFCGYHNNFQRSDGAQVYYAILPYPSCSGCTGGLSVLDALTATTSHEISEALTDPIPGSGWYDDQNGEIGDICAWQFRLDTSGSLSGASSYNVQLEYSDQQGKCI